MSDATYNVLTTDAGVPIKAWTKGVPLEDAARQQLLNVAQLPFIYKWVAAMPDVHWGIGATVGSVIPTRGAIIPAAVGVDIGCGMMAVQTTLNASDLPDNLHGLREAIELAVPVGRTDQGGANDRGAWKRPPDHHLDVWAKMEPVFKEIVDKYPKLEHKQRLNHLGTLGTGNHFIEVCLDEADRVWFMLHSGSRGVGNRLGTFFIELARQDMRKWMINLPDQDLAYLPQGTEHFDDYVKAVHWAQDYALANRQLMMRNIIKAVRTSGLVPLFQAGSDQSVVNSPEAEGLCSVVSCHHNYVAWEHHYGENVLVTRKGAVRARAGDMGIIPGSMGTRSYIVRGKGNPESFMSCSHGAGRAMSRKEAKRRFTVADHIAATKGVECRKDADVIDETPMAYKSIDAVMEAQKDLVEIVHTLRQVICVKG
jgi:tRNA-splicing ligase RtcB